MRPAFYADQFYPGDKAELRKQIENFFGSLELGKQHKKIYGVVVPHAGYIFSGRTAAYAYKTLKQADTKPDLIVIFGTNHSSYDKIVIAQEDFSMPLGIVKNSEISRKITEELEREGFKVGTSEREHSIEVQLPFLQYFMKKFEIIPIIVSNLSLEECKKIARIVYDNIINIKINEIKGGKDIKEGKDRKVFVLASSDFSHYGSNYSYHNKNFQKDDKTAVNEILKLNSDSFLKQAGKLTICGNIAIACTIELCKLLGARKAELLDFSDSSEIFGDRNSIVDYASILFV